MGHILIIIFLHLSHVFFMIFTFLLFLFLINNTWLTDQSDLFLFVFIALKQVLMTVIYNGI